MSTRSKSWASKVLGGAVLAGAVAGFGVTADAAIVSLKLGTISAPANADSSVFTPAATPKAMTVAAGQQFAVGIYVSEMPGVATNGVGQVWNMPKSTWSNLTPGDPGRGGMGAFQTSIQSFQETGGATIVEPVANGVDPIASKPIVFGQIPLEYYMWSLGPTLAYTNVSPGFREDLTAASDPDTDLDTRDMAFVPDLAKTRIYGLGVTETLVGWALYSVAPNAAGGSTVSLNVAKSIGSTFGNTNLQGWTATAGGSGTDLGGLVDVTGVTFGTDAVVTVAGGAIPEPASIGLLGLGSLALLARRRK